MKGPHPMTPTERKARHHKRLRDAGGRNLYLWLSADAAAALDRLRAGGERTIGAVVSAALVAYGMRPPEDSE